MRAILHREMQVAARRKATYFFRAIAAAIGLALAGIFFVIQEELNATGSLLFWMLASAGCFFSVREGFHRAAVSLSEERANGTLGLLFLTPLKSLDIVLGKFTSVSLQAFQMAAVAIPILAISFMVGGVSITEFARATLCLLNLTFFFIALSLLISSITASEVAAVALSLFSIITVCLLGLNWRFFYQWDVPFLWNPILPLRLTSDVSFGTQPVRFWISLLASNAAGWLMLWLASFFLQRTWPKPEVFPKLAVLWTRKKRVKKSRRSARILGDSAPLEWLLIRNIYPSAPLYFALLCIAASYSISEILVDDEGAVLVGVVTMILLTLSLTIHASTTVARANKSGLLELVAAAPLSNFEMVKTQVAGLRRAFLVPALIITAFLATFYDWRKIPRHLHFYNYSWNDLAPLYYLASFLFMLWAVTYMGIWMGLTQKGPARAFFRTAFLTLFFPWILPMPNALYWFILGNVARQTVRTEFRELVLKRPQKPPPFPKINP